MINDTIINVKNYADRLCNDVILSSNDFARDLGVSYGEVWAGITVFVVSMMVIYNLMLLLLLYNSKLRKVIKFTYWTIHTIIIIGFLFIFATIGVAARADAESGQPFNYTKTMIIE